MKKELTAQDLKERKKEIHEAFKKSNSILADFKVYLAVYRAKSKAQVSNLTKDEYLNMQKDFRYNTSHLQKFVKSLENYQQISIETLVLDYNNYALAFNPAVWSVLKLEEKIAVCMLSNIKINHCDVTDYETYNSTGFVLIGNDYKGSFNFGAFFRDDKESKDFLVDIYNFKNIIKDSFYYQKSLKNEYDKICDFESFEEMQYLSPLEPNDELNNCSDEVKSFFWDQIYRRNTRKAVLQALDTIKDASGPINDITVDFYNSIQNDINNIVNTNVFVFKTLGSNQVDRDKKYLKIKVDIFNNSFIKEHNNLVEEHNKLVKKYKATDNALEARKIKLQIDELKKEMQEIKNNIITYEQAEEYFKNYFKIKNKQGCANNEEDKDLFDEEDEKMNLA